VTEHLLCKCKAEFKPRLHQKQNKEKRPQINTLNLCTKELEKGEQIKAKVGRRKEIVKIPTETSKIEQRKIIGKTQ
jgi:hypothetical protein